MDYNDFSNSWWPIIISFIITIIGAIRFYMAGPKCPSNNKIYNKVVLITGASSGLGLATATELANRGGVIILTCRNHEKGVKAVQYIKSIIPDAKIDMRLLDVSRMQDIRDFTDKLKSDYDKLDILINNAGIVFHQYEKTSENLELTFATNYLGPFLLSHLLLPLLRKAENGRIINISAMAHYTATFSIDNINFCKEFMYRQVYGQTKLILVLFTKYFSQLLKDTSVTINAVSPGLLRDTNHFNMSPLASSWMTRISVYPWTWLFMKTPKQGSQSVVYAAIDDELSNKNGVYISDCEIQPPSELVNNSELLQSLYEKSCELCGISKLND